MAAPNLKGGIVEYQSPADRVTLTAGGTITGGQVVKISGGNRTANPAGAADIPFGVALHDAATGDAVTVATEGVWPLKASGAISAGDLVGTGAAGAVVSLGAAGGTYAQAEANEYRTIVGVAEEAIADTATGRVKLRL